MPDLPEVAEHPDNAAVPKRLREFWPIYLHKNGCPQGGSLADRARVFAKYQQLVGILHQAGVPILVGTDAPEPNVAPGYSLHQEMELLVASGMSPAAVLSSATWQNACALGQEREIGSIEAGKLADIVLLGANPLDDIKNTRHLEWVVRSGSVSRPKDVLKLAPSE
jgi:imidazolonepropionase-like amidohydrolase